MLISSRRYTIYELQIFDFEERNLLTILKEETRKLLDDGIMKVWEKYERDAATIAKVYGVSPGTVYAKLEAYCIANRLDYQSFLRFPHRPHKPHVFRVTRKKMTEKPIIKKRNPVRSPRVKVVRDIDYDLEFIIELINLATSEDIDELIVANEMLLNITQTLATGGKNNVVY